MTTNGNGCTKKHGVLLGVFVTIVVIITTMIIPAVAYSKSDGARLEERVKMYGQLLVEIRDKIDRLEDKIDGYK
jgi:hypothetical protein